MKKQILKMTGMREYYFQNQFAVQYTVMAKNKKKAINALKKHIKEASHGKAIVVCANPSWYGLSDACDINDIENDIYSYNINELKKMKVREARPSPVVPSHCQYLEIKPPNYNKYLFGNLENGLSNNQGLQNRRNA